MKVESHKSSTEIMFAHFNQNSIIWENSSECQLLAGQTNQIHLYTNHILLLVAIQVANYIFWNAEYGILSQPIKFTNRVGVDSVDAIKLKASKNHIMSHIQGRIP